MPAKEVSLEEIGLVKVYRRKGVRSIRLSIVGDGSVRVTQPKWLPYKAGIEFAQSRKKWILENSKPQDFLLNQQQVGKTFTLNFTNVANISKPKSRVSGKIISVKMPLGMKFDDIDAQQSATKGVQKALKIDAEELLIPRVHKLAQVQGFKFNSVTVKRLRSRWGSCSQHQDIIFNSYLIQLPWELIDYVILHELQHTKILAHGRDFWHALEVHLPNVKELRSNIKNFQARPM